MPTSSLRRKAAPLLAGALLALAQLPALAESSLQSWPLRADPAAARDDFADLAPLGKALAKARVVALGEQTHGAHEEFAYKLRLLRYLHEKQGFDVLLLESGFYDIGRLTQAMAGGAQLDELSPGNVFYMYSKSAEGRALMRYIDARQRTARPLRLAGIDSQHSGELSRTELLPGLARALAAAGRAELAQGEAWGAYSAHVPALIGLSREAPPAAQQQAFYAQHEAMRAALCAAPETKAEVEGKGWWCQVLLNLESQARSLWSDNRDYQRDNAMGANAIWLMERLFPGRKAVVWAHTIHVARGYQRSPAHLQAGEVMHRHWGPAYQVLNFSTAGGRYYEYVSGRETAVPALPAAALEHRIAARQPGGVTLLRATAPQQVPQFGWEYQTQAPEGQPDTGMLGRHWDWLVFFPQVSPVRMVR
ncbi:erythromycin esterase family protein [Roseateles sp. DAIF2]|uniref:erythromycin esterase family protein n=1 Tax=Roseateles sp. DAIF2 TaxID=2714952 RepID=UPI0018A278F9|nr:erythromycin esterase family protein [Roseateles sp. DAIF2]QPF73722.1 erythromycin esterase family protein [Roseateles sp. DAIF2]